MRRGVLKSNQRLIPGKRAKLNKHGNWTGAQMNKALSNIGHQSDRWQNTNSKTKKKKGKKRFDYFLIPNGHPTLIPGIWIEKKGWAYPFVIFAEKSGKRQAVIDFDKVSRMAVDANFERRCSEAIERAIATARKK